MHVKIMRYISQQIQIPNPNIILYIDYISIKKKKEHEHALLEKEKNMAFPFGHRTVFLWSQYHFETVI